MDIFETRPDTVVIANVTPSVEGGRYPAKRVAGERLVVGADIFKDGHDQVRALLKWRKVKLKGKKRVWSETEMTSGESDRWKGETVFTEMGLFEFTVEAWADEFGTWLHDFERRLTGDEPSLATEIEEGRVILNEAAVRAATGKKPQDSGAIDELAEKLMKTKAELVPSIFASDKVRALLACWPNRTLSTTFSQQLKVVVESPKARFSSWYEFFPRSATGIADKHATFRDCLPRLDDAAKMGFDVVYLPPIHPIGEKFRKGKNNTTTAKPGDVGSPWAIGSKHGGHRSVDPALGTVADFKWLVDEARSRGMEMAMDFAIQCAPDHPYVTEHPEWFFHRPDGTIKYAENPPKKYQDIYSINFHCDEWQELWNELLDVVRFWIKECGVTIFRVDNPHTKPVSFWEWLIGEIHAEYPNTVFLAEAFTKPKMMQALGKVGFTQSYTYFTWRESLEEIIDYVNELTQGEMREYYRGNFWPNTPDILPHHLQHAPPAMFKVRAALAATLSTSWGMYSGYEFCENEPLTGREEYLDSEKYQITERNWNKAGNLKPFIGRLNHIRNTQSALQEYSNIRFIQSDNDRVLAFYKWSDDLQNVILVIVNLDPYEAQESTIHLPLDSMGIAEGERFAAEDLMFEEIYHWNGSANFVSLDPRTKPLHILKVAQ